MAPSIALVHDYLTQRGGAERVALSLTRAFPGAPLHTSLYEPATTFPELAAVDVRPLPFNRFAPLRRNHRLALPVLSPAFSGLRVDADVVVCSSSGWAHGARTTGRKIVYCHTPARWLYQPERYLRGRGGMQHAVASALRPALIRGDRAAALGGIDDARLRWLYRECDGLVAASHEDFGLTPLEAATFGKPSAVLRWGGFLDTVAEGKSGIFFETSTPGAVADAVRELRAGTWDERSILAHAARFSEARFIERIRVIAGAG